jgi:hypothetical protein
VIQPRNDVHRDYDSNCIVGASAYPIPACRIVAVTLPPALDSAFMVSLIAATGAPWSPVTVARVRQRLQV